MRKLLLHFHCSLMISQKKPRDRAKSNFLTLPSIFIKKLPETSLSNCQNVEALPVP